MLARHSVGRSSTALPHIPPALYVALANVRTSAGGPTLQQIAAELAGRWNVPILVEPALAASTRAALPPGAAPLGPSLDTVLAPLRQVTWRRIYLPPGQRERLPDAAALAAATRAVERQALGNLLIEDPQTGRVTTLLKEERGTPSLEPLLHLGKLDARPLYLVYRATVPPEEVPPGIRFADLQRQQLALPLRAEHQALAFVQMIQILQELSPAAREEFTRRTLDAGMRLWESTPAPQRQEMIRQSMQLMQQFGAKPKLASPGTRSDALRPPSPDPIASRGSTRALAAALTERYQARFIVDPALLFSPLLKLPDATLSVEKALAAVAESLVGTAGRRLFLMDAQHERLPSAAKLAAAAREIASLAPGTLLIENAATGRAALYLRDQTAASSHSRLCQQGRFSDHPLYLLYNTIPSARGATVDERVADLQRQQIGLMLRMSPDQMAQSMQEVIHTFPAADLDTRARLMGVPSMAGLMAVWMPREVKERGQLPGDGSR